MTMRYPKPKVGDKVFVAPGRYSQAQDYEVTKVGRQYFYVGKNYRPIKINLNTWYEQVEYGSSRQFYPSKKEWLAAGEIQRKYDNISRLFRSTGRCSMPADTINQVWEIVKPLVKKEGKP